MSSVVYTENMAEGPARVFVWGTPRSLSTVFLKAMTQADNSEMWCSPYLSASRYAPDSPDRQKWKETVAKLAKEKGTNLSATGTHAQAKNLSFGYVGVDASYSWIREQLEKDAPDKKLIFVKEIIFGITGQYDKLPKGFRHAFLLRHPFKSLVSFKKMVSIFRSNVDLRNHPINPPDHFYKHLYEFYQYLKKEKIEEKPIIICTDDLQRNPEGVLKAFCREMKIPFTDKMLQWDDEGTDIMKKWMISKENALNQITSGLHKNTFTSTGFQPPSAELPDRSKLDDDVAAIADMSMKYYEAMYQERLIVN